MKIFILILLIISLFFDWKKFRKNVKDANGEEEIRQEFVPFLLSIILFVIFLISLVF
ncbi:hypothetical protein [Bacillus dakarensis]|uniref:hypothetical protein n=1 Tax=Robertmurraya dakarensis TaxID=1926278 RepID=UPI0012B693E9|nr:hypothetical protein [Bacillus dakarensis]